LEERLSKLLQLFPQFEEAKIRDAAEADPTTEKKYLGWILRLLKKQDIIIPEDSEKIHDILITFDKLKSSPRFTSPKDINQYRSFSDLAQVIRESKGQESKEHKKQIEEKEGQQKIYDDGAYAVVKTTTPAAIMRICEDYDAQGWCVRYPERAKEYSEQGPLYMIFKGGEPYVLAHPESGQLKDVDGKRINLRVSKEIAPILDEIGLGKVKAEEFEKAWLFSHPEELEKRLKPLGNLQVAEGHNGKDINWKDATTYARNYREGGFTDWRLPTAEEAKRIYETGLYKEPVWIWTSESRGSEAAYVYLFNGNSNFGAQGYSHFSRALPVRLRKFGEDGLEGKKEKRGTAMREVILRLGKVQLRAHVADSDSEKRIGLSKHSSLERDQAMLFPYHVPASVTFHMSTVPFPIDMVFLRHAGSGYQVARIVHNVQPGDHDLYHCASVGGVLETAGGFCRTSRIGVGDRVTVHEAAEYQPRWTSLEPDEYVDPELYHYPGMGGGYAKRDRDQTLIVPHKRRRFLTVGDLEEMERMDRARGLGPIMPSLKARPKIRRWNQGRLPPYGVDEADQVQLHQQPPGEFHRVFRRER